MKGIPDKEDQEHTIRWNKKEYQPGKETTATMVEEPFYLAGYPSGNKKALSNPSQTMTTTTIQKSLRAYISVHSASADPLRLSFREKILPVSFQQNLISSFLFAGFSFNGQQFYKIGKHRRVHRLKHHPFPITVGFRLIIDGLNLF